MTEYEMIGKCNRCGRCCTLPVVKIKKRGSNRITEQGLKKDCEFLLIHEDGKTTCVLHREDKPQICLNFPRNSDDLIVGCGYSFKKKKRK